MLDTASILRDGALLSVVASTYLLVLLRFNPRIFQRHYPKEIREIVPPKSEKEQRMSILLGVPLGLLFIGSTFAAVRENLTTPPFFKPPALSAEPPETDVGHRHALASAKSCRFG